MAADREPGSLNERLAAVRQRVAAAELRWRRPAGSVHLIAVSKARSTAEIRQAHALGQQAFGESYAQESADKIRDLSDLAVEWHFVGPLQANKTRLVARGFAWVHSVDRLKIARRLSEQRPPDLAALQVCLQVNVSGETSKSGVAPEQLEELAAQVAALPGLTLRGLMAVPAPCLEFERQRLPFAELRRALERLRAAGHDLDTLSMGMSDDLEAAIAEGATMVRIGTAIFGERG